MFITYKLSNILISNQCDMQWIDFNIRFNLQKKCLLTSLKANIYKHQNYEPTRYISLIISVIKKFRFPQKSRNFTKIQEISRKCMNIGK